MEENSIVFDDNHIDDHVDQEIRECILSTPPKSFFMFAGAGSGKTRSLINVLDFIKKEKGEYLIAYGKQVAVITYTNAGCDEIERRLQYSQIFMVSTIHSFLWEMIQNFQVDIKNWLIENIQNSINELKDKQLKSTINTKNYLKLEDKISHKQSRLEKIKTVSRFSYNPNGDNIGIDSLNHDEVIKMGTQFIQEESVLQEILVTKYPYLFIDESQDTNKNLISSLLEVYKNHKQNWLVGMFGDMMQRIYLDGKENLENEIPESWAFPQKIMNHRSSKRIVELANNIRKLIDNKKQKSRVDAIEGQVRLFIASCDANKDEIEKKAACLMAESTNDEEWNNDNSYKSLILEHHMAASRFHFSGIYVPLNESKEFDKSLKDGSIAELSLLANVIFPLIKAYRNKNYFEVTKILRLKSPLLDKKHFVCEAELQQKQIEIVDKAVNALLSLWDNSEPSCIDILRKINEFGLFQISNRIEDILDNSYSGNNQKVIALKSALSVSIEELERYSQYISGKTRFDTHQGVKGLEFPRVMVILDDSESKGFLFKYEKIFEVDSLTKTDIQNEQEGKDTSTKRTLRLFYVACTRAKDSLAIVVYTKDPYKARQTAIKNGWFSENEIEILI